MNKSFIFVSCGQFTEMEKSVGKAICKIVKDITGIDAFFAEEVQDLNGLDSNILCALHDAVGFITVLHSRGAITRPDGAKHVRASVWIEQEIAIATYIQRSEKRTLPVIAFVHKSVGREGLRDLLNLNPRRFANEAEILAALPELLEPWKRLSPTGFSVHLQAEAPVMRDEHWTRRLRINLINNTNSRLASWSGLVRLPTGILKHWATKYIGEELSTDRRYRSFRLSEEGHDPIPPHSTALLTSFDYCTKCAAEHSGETAAIAATLVGDSVVNVQVWIEGKEYSDEKTLKELSA